MFVFHRFGLIVFLAVMICSIVGCSTKQNTPIASAQDVFRSINTDSLSNFDSIPENAITVDSLQKLTTNMLRDSSFRNQPLSAAAGWVFNINMPSFFSQIDPAWKNNGLGYNYDGRSTISRYGCHLCCVAMLYAKWGLSSVKPPVLNNWKVGSSTHFAFSTAQNGDLIRLPYALQYPATCRDTQTISYDQIYTALSRGYPVIIEINYPASNPNNSHFMVIYAFDGARYWVLDPLQPPAQGAIPLWGTGYGGCCIKSIRLYGYHL